MGGQIHRTSAGAENLGAQGRSVQSVALRRPVVARHGALGEMTETVTVTDGETANVDFVITPKG